MGFEKAPAPQVMTVSTTHGAQFLHPPAAPEQDYLSVLKGGL